MPPWAPYPGAPTPWTLFLEAFGHLTRVTGLTTGPVTDEEDLYSVFRARAELMSWSTFEPADRQARPRLWSLEEAELTTGSHASQRIGWVQVGTSEHIEPATALPSAVQCFDDALARFGSMELSGVQVTCRHLPPGARSCLGELNVALNWFNISSVSKTDAIAFFDTGLLTGPAEVEAVAERLQAINTGPFEFRSPVTTPQGYSIEVPVEAPFIPPDHGPVGQLSAFALPVTLPEWTASAIGWVLAIVIDTARTQHPAPGNFTLQIVRTA